MELPFYSQLSVAVVFIIIGALMRSWEIMSLSLIVPIDETSRYQTRKSLCNVFDERP